MSGESVKKAHTYKGSLVGKRVKVDQLKDGGYFMRIYGRRGFDVNDVFIIKADQKDSPENHPESRIITFEDSKGNTATGLADSFVIID